MKRTRTKKTSEVDKALSALKRGDSIPVTGSVSYWRNRQARFHQENPKLWVMISKVETGFIAERIK